MPLPGPSLAASTVAATASVATMVLNMVDRWWRMRMRRGCFVVEFVCAHDEASKRGSDHDKRRQTEGRTMGSANQIKFISKAMRFDESHCDKSRGLAVKRNVLPAALVRAKRIGASYTGLRLQYRDGFDEDLDAAAPAGH